MEEISKRITGEVAISPSILSKSAKAIKNIADFKTTLSDFLKKSTTEAIEVMLAGAINLDASDIHIEPEKDQARLRLRIDGILQDVLLFDLKTYSALLSRIKLISGLKLNVTSRPQDGRFSILLKESSIEIRSSTLPSEYGEAVVLRILNPKNLIGIEDLGLRKDLLEVFQREIKKPHGMIVVTGPTGSGKTTTLYAILKKIQKSEIKIITIEDPIEYHLTGISQTQVDSEKGYDFASGLKSIVRQDPDVILVGEIRDLETASIALQAALTGHLVLTTLHTNDAAGAVARLQALGEKAINIAPAINLVIAQRLVRKICANCAQLVPASPKIKKIIQDALKKMPSGVETPPIKGAFKIPQVKKCKECNFTGYKGRLGVFEAFAIDDEIEKFILTKPSIAALKELAVKKGMTTMHQDGVIKVLNKITTIEEVERVMGE